jgi:hypothetical protein
LANLSEKHIISTLIDGLPQSMIEKFITVRPQSYSEFYFIAKKAEESFKDNPKYFNKNIKNKFSKTVNLNKSKVKPPKPCYICEKLGFKNRFHWVNECRNKNKLNIQNQSKSNSINSKSINFIQSNKINENKLNTESENLN